MANLWYVGAILGVLASMAGTTGKQLFRFSELQHRKDTKVSLYTAKVTRVAAFVINTILGPLIDMTSYAFAPQSMIAPLGALDVVWNTMTAPCTLGEKLTSRTLVGCALIFSGATATSFVGGKHDGTYTVEQIQDYILHWRTFVYLLCLAVWLLFNICVLIPRSASPRGEPWTSGDPWRGLSLGMTAGSLSGNMFCVKAFVEIVQGSIENRSGEYWAHWLPYLLLVCAVFFAVSNLYFLDKAMREYEALFMGAVFEGSVILAASVSGCVVFDELSYMDSWGIVVYWFALATILVGIRTVARDAVRKAREEVDEASAAAAGGLATADVEKGAAQPEPLAALGAPPAGEDASCAGGREAPAAAGAADGSQAPPADAVGAADCAGAPAAELGAGAPAPGLPAAEPEEDHAHQRSSSQGSRAAARPKTSVTLQEATEFSTDGEEAAGERASRYSPRASSRRRLPAVRVKRHRGSVPMSEPLFGHASAAAAGSTLADGRAGGGDEHDERLHERAASAAAVPHAAVPPA